VGDLLLIPAAGRGSRLGSALPKALVPVNGAPMLEHLLRLYSSVAQRFVVVVAPGNEPLFRDACDGLPYDIELVVQREPTGMLDAILVAAGSIAAASPRRVWITWCDQIAVLPPTVARLAGACAAHPDAPLLLPTSLRDSPYIHFARDGSGRIDRVLQRREGDRMPDVGESDIGLFVLSADAYLRLLPRFASHVEPAAGTGERNFLPFIPWVAHRATVVTVPATDPIESVGINTAEELDTVASYLRGAAAAAGARA
jgi:bifunctional UDP-N-acetylglucosamine pyrophosphorylase / glucosamine-1-phosphate N-acetyltransferase